MLLFLHSALLSGALGSHNILKFDGALGSHNILKFDGWDMINQMHNTEIKQIKLTFV